MRKIFTKLFLLFGLILVLHDMQAQERYVDEVTQEVMVMTDVQYGRNSTVIGGAANIVDTPLIADIYMPMVDSVMDRPLVIYCHTGSFLPRGLNGGTTGEKDDYTVTEVCTRLAKRGYVAAAISYRKGWNPLAGTLAERTSGLINAAYRGTQDFRSAVRFFRKSVAEEGNPYGLDPERIAGWGQGTGGYIVLAAATLQQEEIYIPKFQDPVSGASFIDTNFIGDIDALRAGFISSVQTPGYPSDIQFGFQHGGALGDSSWIDENTPPFASAHVIQDPFAPFGVDPVDGSIDCEGLVIVPTTQEPVVNVAGPNCFIEILNARGNNDILATADLSDPINSAIASKPFGKDNLFPFVTTGPQAGPWDFWDQGFWSNHPEFGDLNTTSLIFNSDMSLQKANAYIDTLMAVFIPRSYVALSLAPAQPDPVAIDLTFEEENRTYQIFPFGENTAAIIDNPDQSGENTSEKVIEMTKPTNAMVWAGVAIPLDEAIDGSRGPLFTVQVWSPRAGVPMMLKIEDRSTGSPPTVIAEIITNTTVASAWETLTFDMTGHPDYNSANNYDGIALFADMNNPGLGETFYLDNVDYEMGVGFEDLYGDNEFFKVYPNPTSDILNISYRVTGTSRISFKVLNALGQIVMSTNADTKLDGDYVDRINVSNLSSGVHYLLLDLDGQLVSKRVFVKE